MRPFALEDRQVSAAGDELSAKRCNRTHHLLAVTIEHRLVFDRLSRDHVRLHDQLLALTLGGKWLNRAIPHTSHNIRFPTYPPLTEQGSRYRVSTACPSGLPFQQS